MICPSGQEGEREKAGRSLAFSELERESIGIGGGSLVVDDMSVLTRAISASKDFSWSQTAEELCLITWSSSSEALAPLEATALMADSSIVNCEERVR